MATRLPNRNPEINTVKIPVKSQLALKDYLLQCKILAWQNWNIRESMRRVDLEYARELDYTEEGLKSQIAVRSGDANKFRNITIPVVLPQVEAEVTYQASVFLTGVPLFGVVSAPNLMGPAKQLETIIDQQAIRGGWVDEFTMFFRDGAKYNFGILENEWKRELIPGVSTDLSAKSTNYSSIQPLAWEGNQINRWDPYNTFWDIRYSTAQIAKRGEFIGNTEMISRVELKSYLINTPNIISGNIKSAMESPTPAITITGDSSLLTYYIPQISQWQTINPQLFQGFNWLAWAGLEKSGTQINYKNIYMRTKLYARIIPSDFDIECPGKNTPQMWKFVFINDDTLVYAQPVASGFDTFPVFMSEPNRDGLSYQTKSSGQNVIDYQNIATALGNSSLAARRRAVSDRVLYDPSRIAEAQINSPNPSAKIPVRPAAYGKPLQEAVYPFPFRDDQAGVIWQEVDTMQRMADRQEGSNPTQQGQFVKGNKTRREFDSTMNNANGRKQLRAMVLECQVMTPLKESLKLNILQFQTPATMYSRELQAPVEVDPVSLRKASLVFKVSDGLIPSEKLISGDSLSEAFQALAQSPGIAQGYNLSPMFSYLMKTQGADLAPFEKSQSQLAYEQAVAAWQNAIAQAMDSLKIVLKSVDPTQVNNIVAQFQQALPPQPKPQDFGYDPSANPITTNTDPTSTILSQTGAITNPPSAQSQSQNTQQSGNSNGNSTS